MRLSQSTLGEGYRVKIILHCSGYTITCITGYYADPDKCVGGDIGGHYLSIADTTGTIRLLTLPRHMHETPASEEEDTRDFTLRETERLKFITERSVGAGEEGDKKKEKDKKGGGEEPEAEEAADEAKEEEITPQQQLYNHYLKVNINIKHIAMSGQDLNYIFP